MNQKLREVKRTLGWVLLVVVAIATSFMWLKEGWTAGLVTLLAALCLALGLWVTELLVGVFVGVKKANPTAIALLMAAKFGWWGAIFLGSRHVPAGHETAIALGIGAFLVALLVTGIFYFGMPKIADVDDGKPVR